MRTITWDEPKRLANLAKHGMDFNDLTEDFFLGALVIPARNGRFQAFGSIEDGTISVIFAVLGTEGLSLISMRSASAAERKLL